MRNRKPMTFEQLKVFIYAGKSGFLMTNTKTGVSKEYLVVQSKDKKRWYVCVPFIGYIGTLFAGPHANVLIHTPNSKVDQVSKEFFIFRWLMKQIWDKECLPTTLEVTHNGNCGRCGRKLTDDKSVERGYGPHCWKMVSQDHRFWKRIVEGDNHAQQVSTQTAVLVTDATGRTVQGPCLWSPMLLPDGADGHVPGRIP